jgi:hypothetical protein
MNPTFLSVAELNLNCPLGPLSMNISPTFASTKCDFPMWSPCLGSLITMNSIPGVDGSDAIEKALAVYFVPVVSTPAIIMNIPGSNGHGCPSSGMNFSVSTSGVSSFFSLSTYFLSVTGITAIETPLLDYP